MEIYRSACEISALRPAAIALGFFDGMHLGHTELIRRTVAFAKERDLYAAVFTFRDHPKNIMTGTLAVPRLSTEAEKLIALETLGIDCVFDFDFADGFHEMTPEAFAKDLLKDAFAAEAVFCGFNFRFGAGATGSTDVLAAYGKAFGFEAYVVEPIYIDGRLVSSTIIRHSVGDGDVDTVARLLGRPYGISGNVEHGRRLGRSLGFPTANIIPEPGLTLPAFGVYVTVTLVDGESRPSVSNIGINPTISAENAVRIETHILDTDTELYNKKIVVSFLKMLREERRFESEEALKKQIATDAEEARRYHSSCGTARFSGQSTMRSTLSGIQETP
ncbi:MAG: bifunctional riboflavin kinase/FAD synthetase [Clostridiales bacterium]|nr:bifunctional riboflavin kinase/FAD synthetase [Clostridiales bacterium]